MNALEKADKIWQLYDLCRELRLDVEPIKEIVDKRLMADRLGETLTSAVATTAINPNKP